MPDGKDQTNPAPADPVDAAAAQRAQMTKAVQQAGGSAASVRADAQALSPLSQDGRVGTISWNFDVKTVADVKPATIEKLDATMTDARDDGLTVEVDGRAPRTPEPGQPRSSA